MIKSDLLKWLQEEYRQWEKLLDQIGPDRMDQGGLAGYWSFKDIIAHLTPDYHRAITNIQATQRGEAEPPPPWPAHLQTDEDINAWIYETNRERSLRAILDDSEQAFQQLIAVVEELPDDIRIDIKYQAGREYYFVWLDNQRIQPGYFFDHFHDDHEEDVRAWLARIEEG